MITLATSFEVRCPELLLVEEAGPSTFLIQPNGLMTSLAIALSQEMVKFNRCVEGSYNEETDMTRTAHTPCPNLRHHIRSCGVLYDSIFETEMTHLFNQMNRLLNTMRSSLRDIKNAIKGMIVMSSDLDSMYTAFLNNQVGSIVTVQESTSISVSISTSISTAISI